ncbi:MAG: thioredoxin [Betaproteobacteria bacterium]|nr:thioredoxin [Pseudomonadota bacterium]NBO04304.1 thioredoxin [Betaproteobacteria bacterium]NBO96008.1 thioredoxin [Betaproteobacteria bacterium]NBP35186.1 thioredoxin [Betaproteobacteria bacterium]NBP37518.1 thioredoxin [Betaproteobacteria bacterium]
MLDLSESRFEEAVLEVSKQQAVLVDFWAPWCGPCRTLGPMLEKLSLAYEGRVYMVKVNADHAPQLSQRYQIRSLPMVMLFKDSKVVDQFVGLRQESEIRHFIDRHLPRLEDKDLAVARQRVCETQYEEACELYKRVLVLNPAHELARLEWVQVLLQLSMWGDAAQSFETLRPKRLSDPKIAAVAFLVDAALALEAGGLVETKLHSDLSDPKEPGPDHAKAPQQKLREAQLAMLSGRWTEAMDGFLDLLAHERQFAAELIRQSMLAIFQLCPDPQLVGQYRRRLGALLH